MRARRSLAQLLVLWMYAPFPSHVFNLDRHRNLHCILLRVCSALRYGPTDYGFTHESLDEVHTASVYDNSGCPGRPVLSAVLCCAVALPVRGIG